MLSDSESHAPISPLHLAVSFKIFFFKACFLFYLSLTLHSLKKDSYLFRAFLFYLNTHPLIQALSPMLKQF